MYKKPLIRQRLGEDSKLYLGACSFKPYSKFFTICKLYFLLLPCLSVVTKSSPGAKGMGSRKACSCPFADSCLCRAEVLEGQSRNENNVPSRGNYVGPSRVRCYLNPGPRGDQGFPLPPLCKGCTSVPFQVVAPDHVASCVGHQAFTPPEPETGRFPGAFPWS